MPPKTHKRLISSSSRETIPIRASGPLGTGLYPSISRVYLSQMTGIHRPNISAILNGQRDCSREMAKRLARVIGITLDRLDRDLEGIQKAMHPEWFR